MCKHDFTIYLRPIISFKHIGPFQHLQLHLFTIHWKRLVHILWICRSRPPIFLSGMNKWGAVWRQAQPIMCRSHQWRLVNEGGQCNVTLGQPPTVMCAESDLDLGEQRKMEQRWQNCEYDTYHVTRTGYTSFVNLSVFVWSLFEGWNKGKYPCLRQQQIGV